MRHASGPFSALDLAEFRRSLAITGASASRACSEVVFARAMLLKAVIESETAMAKADEVMRGRRRVLARG
jgi:hypothetical protein